MTFAVIWLDARPAASEAPGLLAMAVCYLLFAVIGIFCPAKLRDAIEKMVNSRRKRRSRPLRIALNTLRWVIGVVGIVGAVLFTYMAILGFTR